MNILVYEILLNPVTPIYNNVGDKNNEQIPYITPHDTTSRKYAVCVCSTTTFVY